MDAFDKIKENYSIDMVEYSEENRKVLEEIELKDFIELKKTKDFLEFFPSKQYDFIFMNPPFHLDTKFNKQYKKDVYDYDFVKRAYACLKENGVLFAITGIKWKDNADIKKWYSSKNAVIEDKTFNWSG
jgi:16S rRNA G1207 methylase RsmC